MLSDADEQLIIDTFKKHDAVDSLSAVPSYEDMEEKSYDFSAGVYSDIKVDYEPITADEFEKRITKFRDKFADMQKRGALLDDEIQRLTEKLYYGK